MILSSAAFAGWAKEAGFELVGFARAEPIDPQILGEWLSAGYAADLDWMGARLDDRLDVSRLLPGAKTVVALACNYWSTDDPSPIARYARGRDYHATLRDRIRALRRSLRAHAPGVHDYGSVDSNPVMEKVWAVQAGLGYVGRSGCLITERFGSWVVLAAIILDAEVDTYATGVVADRCGSCNLCLVSCPTGAIAPGRMVDAAACLSYQTIENVAPVPEALRPALTDTVFGCDVCQEVCPLNTAPLVAHARFAPRPVAALSPRQLAALTPAEYAALAPGSPLARVQYDGLRRNAAYTLGATRDGEARAVLTALADDASPRVREAARWALGRLPLL